MRQRGRKSAEAMLVPLTGRQPAVVCPSTLNDGERAVWRRTIARLPLGWLQPEQAELAANYCRHAAEAARLREAARDPELDLGAFCKLSSVAQRESALALAHARALRMTPQSRIRPEAAGRRAGVASGPPPVDWDEHFRRKREEAERGDE